MDEMDMAQERAQKDLDTALAAARAKPKTQPRPESCLNDCGEPPAAEALYCSPECQHDHEERKAKQRRLGAR